MSGLLSLKWNNHSSVFLNLLQNLRNKELYCDTTIACQGHYYPVHKLVLSSCSEYFEEIFQRTQCKHPFIIMKDIDPADLESLLNYMYKGEVNVLQEALSGLIKAAESLKIKGLAVPDELPTKETLVRERKRQSSSITNCQSKKSRLVEKKNRTIEYNCQDSNDLSQTESSTEGMKTMEVYRSESPNSHAGSSYSSHCIEHPLVQTSDELEEGDKPGRKDPEEVLFSEEVFVKVEPSTVDDSSLEPPAVDDSSLELNAKEETTSFNSLHPQNSENELNFKVKRTDSFKLPTFLNQPHQECSDGPSGIAEESHETSMATFLMSHNLLPTIRDSEKDIFIRHNKNSTQSFNIFKHNCNYCSYGSYSSSAVRKHEMRIHTGVKPFNCSQCPYSSTTHDGLRIHIRSHTGEKPYICHDCPYRSSCYANLKKHTRIHKIP